MHGGKLKGAPAGNRRALKHGLYTAETIDRRQKINQLLRDMKDLAAMATDGDRRAE
jgi:hypothetical protein